MRRAWARKSRNVESSVRISLLPARFGTLRVRANICPMVDQIEYHPGFTQKECVEFCQKNNILVEAWTPLGRGNVLDNPLLKSIAANHGKSVAQVVIRWVM